MAANKKDMTPHEGIIQVDFKQLASPGKRLVVIDRRSSGKWILRLMLGFY
jgi:hypothetical protein